MGRIYAPILFFRKVKKYRKILDYRRETHHQQFRTGQFVVEFSSQ
jgi:hypothetical protein